MSTNDQRAQWAEACLTLFVAYTDVEELVDAVGDLITNLGHFSDRNGLPFLGCVETAIGHWHLEKTNEDSIDPLPRVTITIEP